MQKNEFGERGERMLAAIHPGVLVVPAAPLATRNDDVAHQHGQDPDSYSATDFYEPAGAFSANTRSAQRFTSFVYADPERELRYGARAGVEGGVSQVGADHVFAIGALALKLPAAIQNLVGVCQHPGKSCGFDRWSPFRVRGQGPSTAEYRARRVRIEDDVLVTDERATVPSDASTKRVYELERVCSLAA